MSLFVVTINAVVVVTLTEFFVTLPEREYTYCNYKPPDCVIQWDDHVTTRKTSWTALVPCLEG